MTQVHVIVTGVVQGVGYRAWTAQIATRFGISGWVRNRRDGSVEMVLSGPASDVEAMLAELPTGPVSSSVDTVTVNPLHEAPGPGFGVLPTA